MTATKTAPKTAALELKLPPEVAAAATLEKKGPLMIDLVSIERPNNNPREDFDAAEIQALAASMSSVTLLAPLTVTPIDEPPDGRYRLVAGERRLRAAKLAGWRRIPCYVVNGPPELLAEMAVAENLLRKDLNLIETARAIAWLNKPIAKGGAGLSLAKIAERMGRKDAWAVKMVSLLKLPPNWQQKLAAGELFARQGWALAGYADRPDVLAAVEQDTAHNPQDWSSSEGFERQLTFVVERLDALAQNCNLSDETSDSVPCLPGEASSPPAPGDRPLRALHRRSAPVRHDFADESQDDAVPAAGEVDAATLIGSSEVPVDPVAAILALIPRLTTLGQIERVERALKQRELQIHGLKRGA
jgi:ParB/RepB/Spo0J family partition protein